MQAIQFSTVPNANDTMSFSYYPNYPDQGVTESLDCVFKVFRLVAGQVSVASSVVSQAATFANAYNADYAPLLTFTAVGDMVMIEAANGSPLFGFVQSGSFAALVVPMADNVIHIINFSPRRYAVPGNMLRGHLITETGENLTTEDGKQIKL